ncbi:hypothetical protein PR048_022491 [Dryococelus australis]|uniref:Uncharacterized protein n=1 Tax=Dryococelus australis TaxID=614101 RepID=A0ABQ9H163_9NEOP|nr:hypothetical protein PR048_022491 [Dryococelus australis]
MTDFELISYLQFITAVHHVKRSLMIKTGIELLQVLIYCCMDMELDISLVGLEQAEAWEQVKVRLRRALCPKRSRGEMSEFCQDIIECAFEKAFCLTDKGLIILVQDNMAPDVRQMCVFMIKPKSFHEIKSWAVEQGLVIDPKGSNYKTEKYDYVAVVKSKGEKCLWVPFTIGDRMLRPCRIQEPLHVLLVKILLPASLN